MLFKKIWCWVVGHKNTLTIVNSKYQAVAEACERCRCELPYGYPYQEQLKRIIGDTYPTDGIHLDFNKVYGDKK
jgi:hypothetical protein